MFKKILFSLIAMAFCFGTLFTAAPARAAECTTTGYYRDGINLTAAYINPVGLTGEVDATGCHIGVYFDTSVGSAVLDGVEIYGANYFGVLVDGYDGAVAVNITDSYIHDIGEVSFNGAQHGVGIYYTTFEGSIDNGVATGMVDHTKVEAYQKGGIAVNGVGADVSVTHNDVVGLGRVSFIAQNGIQFGWGAKGVITDNKVSDNFYWCRGPEKTCSSGWVSAGILLYQPDPSLTDSGAAATLKEDNTLVNNQVAVLIVR